MDPVNPFFFLKYKELDLRILSQNRDTSSDGVPFGRFKINYQWKGKLTKNLNLNYT